jgi:hypothetical protein
MFPETRIHDSSGRKSAKIIIGKTVGQASADLVFYFESIERQALTGESQALTG